MLSGKGPTTLDYDLVTVRVSVAPGTQPGSVLRLAGKGLPRTDNRHPGDLYIAIDVRVPTSLDPEQRRLYEALRAWASGDGP